MDFPKTNLLFESIVSSLLEESDDKLTNSIFSLKAHLTQSDEDKGFEVLNHESNVEDLMGEFSEELQDFLKGGDYDFPYEIIEKIQSSGNEGFISELEGAGESALEEYNCDWSESLTFLCMEYDKIVEAEARLIHFTDSPYEVLNNGFKGHFDYRTLGLTTHRNDRGTDDGYGFAFEEGTRYARNGHSKYGNSAVSFKSKSPSIKVWHHGDEEYQIIFDTTSVDKKDIVIVVETEYEWLAESNDPQYWGVGESWDDALNDFSKKGYSRDERDEAVEMFEYNGDDTEDYIENRDYYETFKQFFKEGSYEKLSALLDKIDEGGNTDGEYEEATSIIDGWLTSIKDKYVID